MAITVKSVTEIHGASGHGRLASGVGGGGGAWGGKLPPPTFLTFENGGGGALPPLFGHVCTLNERKMSSSFSSYVSHKR